jgi:hypothetical protein
VLFYLNDLQFFSREPGLEAMDSNLGASEGGVCLEDQHLGSGIQENVVPDLRFE